MPFPNSSGRLIFAAAGGLLFVASLLVFFYQYTVGFHADPAASLLRSATVDVALFSIFALHHSLLARSGAKHAVQQRLPPALERSVYTWIASILFLTVCLGWRSLPVVVYTLPGAARYAGLAAQLAGVYLTVRGSAALDVLNLAGVRQVLRGSAAAHVPLNTGGVYRLVRHPLYFGWLLMVFGAPVMTATHLLFACVSTGYLIVAIPFEERSLIAAFGAEYLGYQQQTRWRIVPGLW